MSETERSSIQNTAFIGLGSNINPIENFRAAVNLLTQMTHLEAISTVWETIPIGLTDQPNFLNAVALIKTPLDVISLKQNVTRHIEQVLQRERQVDNQNGPRTIDLDIVLFNQDITTVGGSHIPDPDIYTRPFLAIPLAEIASDYLHPETGETLQQIADRFVNPAESMIIRPDITNLVRFEMTQTS